MINNLSFIYFIGTLQEAGTLLASKNVRVNCLDEVKIFKSLIKCFTTCGNGQYIKSNKSCFSWICSQVMLISKPNVSRQSTKDKEACKNIFSCISNQVSAN